MDNTDDLDAEPSGDCDKEIAAGEREQLSDAVIRCTAETEAPSETNVGLFEIVGVRAQVNNRWADLRAECAFSRDGKTFSGHSLRYWATPNGLMRGGAYIRLESPVGDTGRLDMAHGYAEQVGDWRDVHAAGGTIHADAHSVKVWFYFIYQESFGNIPMQGFNTVWYTPPTLTVNSIKTVVSPFSITGSDGVLGARITIHSGNQQIGTGNVTRADGIWSVEVTNTANTITFTASQTVNTRESARTAPITVYNAATTSPTQDELITHAHSFSARGAPGTQMLAYSGEATNLTVRSLVGPTGVWQEPMSATIVSGPHTMKTQYLQPAPLNNHGYTNVTRFRMLGYPVITNTPLTVPQGFPLIGRNRLSGATVTAFIGSSSTAVGTAAAGTTDTFSITTNNLEPGAHALTVEQFHSSKASGRSAAVTFRVQPNQPTVQFKLENDVPTLYGAGFRNASVDVSIHNSGSFIEAVVGSNGAWSKSVPATVLPGTYDLVCRQNVKDQNNAPIWSAYTTPQSFNIPTPVPTSVASNKEGQKLRFSGRGTNWQTALVVVVIYNNGVDMRPGVPNANVTNGIWGVVSTVDYPPGTYNQLTAMMWVNGVFSRPVAVPSVIILSPPPVLTPNDKPTGQLPRISGTMWNGSVVVVTVAGKSETAITNGATFSLVATVPWAPGTYLVSVTATFGGQTSTPSTQSLTVRTPLPKIKTSGPVPLTAIIEGEGWRGCVIKIFTIIGNQELGSGIVKSDDTFEITLLTQAAGGQTLFALQYESGNASNVSDESVRVDVTFGVPVADITKPAEGGTTPRVSVFSGTTDASSGTIELWLGEVLLKNNIAINDGNWSAPGIALDAGPKAVRVYVRQGGDLSAANTRNMTVVPEKLKIDSPLTTQNIGHQVRVSGVGAFPGDEVIVRRVGMPQDFLPVPVDERGNWTTPDLAHFMVSTDKIAAIARAGLGLDSDVSDPIIPQLLHGPQHITQPQAGDRVGTKPVFAGLARPLAAVTIAQWYNDAIELATTEADAHGYWQVQSTVALAEGGNWVRMRDTLDGQHSEWRKSERFEVKAIAPGFAAPTLDYPVEGEKVSRRTIVSGRGLAGALVRVYRHGVGSEVLGAYLVGRDGKWSGHLNKVIATGSFVISVWQARDGSDSKWMTPDRTVEVMDAPPDFGQPVFLEPPPDTIPPLEAWAFFSGKGFSGASTQVFEGTTLLGEAIVDTHGQWSLRTAVELVVQAEPHIVCARQVLGDNTSPWSTENTQFMVTGRTLHPPVVVDPADKDVVSPNPVIYLKAMPGSMVSLFPELTTNKIGTGYADESGCCVIPLYDLPLGRYVVRGKTEKSGILTGWMTPVEVTVVNLG